MTTMRSSERGAMTIYAVIAGFALSLGTLVGVQATALIRLRHEVAAAADLAAIAASTAAVEGGDGCSAAERVARTNGVEVVNCAMTDAVATITTRGESDEYWGHRFAFEVDARAAPTSYLPADTSSMPSSSSSASAKSASSRTMAPALWSGSLPLPHLGE